MVITFMGMSGSGKTTLSRLLAKNGWTYYGCDDRIEESLSPELQASGYTGIEGLARWMGQPYDPQYSLNSRRYLEIEEQVTRTILAEIRDMPSDVSIVIDTTGSIIYLPEPVIHELCELSTVIGIDTPDSVLNDMLEIYITDPKPVVWGDHYRPVSSSTPHENIVASYPSLLRYRRSRYQKYSHHLLPLSHVWNPQFDITSFIASL